MSVFENMKIALSSLLAHKLRSILTMLGIIIGVGSVIAVVAIGQGGEAMLKSQLAGEDNTVDLFYEPSEDELETNPNALLEAAFTDEDIQTIEDVQGVQHVIGSSTESTQIHHQEESVDGTITGINQQYIDVNQLDISTGRALQTDDFISGNRIAIVSESFQTDLFDGNEMLNKVIHIDSQPVKIVGVLDKEDSLFDLGANDVYLPLQTWQTIFKSTDINEVSIQAETPEQLKETGERAINILNRIHDKEDAYQLINMEEIAEGIGQITNVMTIIISSIAGISLFVGGIGVMNIMLVSVTERTREIGIRMSIGATRGQISMQFLIESMTLTLFGGIIGMLLGAGGAMLVSSIAGWPALVSLPVIVGGVLFSMLIGIIFGILPANKAAQLNPINALNHE